jgi:hypothetical protein
VIAEGSARESRQSDEGRRAHARRAAERAGSAGSRAVVYTLILSKTGVKLGLARGSELDDPQGLLEGKGKVHRYISLRAPADLRAPGVRRLVQGAYSAWKQRK